MIQQRALFGTSGKAGYTSVESGGGGRGWVARDSESQGPMSSGFESIRKRQAPDNGEGNEEMEATRCSALDETVGMMRLPSTKRSSKSETFFR